MKETVCMSRTERMTSNRSVDLDLDFTIISNQESAWHFEIVGVGPIYQETPWRNGSASDSRSEGCVFESRRGQIVFS